MSQHGTTTAAALPGAVAALGDGTLVVDDDRRGELGLGPGGALQRGWIKVVRENS